MPGESVACQKEAVGGICWELLAILCSVATVIRLYFGFATFLPIGIVRVLLFSDAGVLFALVFCVRCYWVWLCRSGGSPTAVATLRYASWPES